MTLEYDERKNQKSIKKHHIGIPELATIFDNPFTAPTIVAKEVKKLDVSAMQAQFVIAKCCLEDNTAKIYELLSKTYPDSFDAVSIRDWPIFLNFRETEEYKSFLKEHKNDFAIQEMTVDNNEFVLMNDA